MKVEMVDRPQIRVACLRHTGPPGEAVGRFWRQRVSPWLAEHGMLDCPRYGVTRGADCYDACVELRAGLSLPDSAEMQIPGGLYATTCFKGTSAAIGAAWKEFARLRAAYGSHLNALAHWLEIPPVQWVG